MSELLDELRRSKVLRTPRIIEAFERISRADFVPPSYRPDAKVNLPLPIGHGQTISQPYTVAFMLELLQAETGQNVLDVGAGSGWQTALLAHIIGPEGRVTAIERIPELKRFGERNVRRYHLDNVTFILGDGSQGFSPAAPFDRIIVAAAATEIPPILLDQLKVGGRLVIPVGEWTQDVTLVERTSVDTYETTRHPGFQFVPLIPE